MSYIIIILKSYIYDGKKKMEQIKKQMRKYQAEEFELYCDEAGWQEWMNKYTSSPDGEPCTEKEVEYITQIQKDLWNEVHQ
jgi:hypothetical protein